MRPGAVSTRSPRLPLPPACLPAYLQDQVCYGMYNQATVHQYRAEFVLFRAAKAGAPAADVAAEAEAHLQVRGGGPLPAPVLTRAWRIGISLPRCRRQPTAQPLCLPACSPPTKQKAEAQLDAAIAYKPAFLDGYLGKSQLAQLRAKVAANYLITPAK